MLDVPLRGPGVSMTRWLHDSELPSELCDDPDCDDHHPRCEWGDPTCDRLGINRINGRAYCIAHTEEIARQIATLTEATRV
jgi:hypothetical protein